MTYLLPLGTPLRGTKKEIEELIKELDSTISTKEFITDIYGLKYEVNITDYIDTAKFNGISKDICIMYISFANQPDNQNTIMVYLEYHQERSYDDIARILMFVLGLDDDVPIYHINDAIEND